MRITHARYIMRHVVIMVSLIGLLVPVANAQAINQFANQTVYEVQVRGLPPAGRAWAATRPVQDLPRVTLQNIVMDTSTLVIRVRGRLNRDALERALADSGLTLVYISERGGN